jgi:hypothetical protein
MKTINQIIDVDVVYDVDDIETISVEIRANGFCRKIDERLIKKGLSSDRYSFDVDMKTLTWDRDEYTSTANKCIEKHIQDNHKEICRVFVDILFENTK